MATRAKGFPGGSRAGAAARPRLRATGGSARPAWSAPISTGRDWRWLCLDHVREFNADSNYFNGMTPTDQRGTKPYGGGDRETAPSANGSPGPRGRFTDARCIRARPGPRARHDGRELSESDAAFAGLGRPTSNGVPSERYAECSPLPSRP